MQTSRHFSFKAPHGRSGCVGVRLFVAALIVAPHLAHAACNLIPQTEKSFDSVRGATTRPFAAAGEPIELRLRPCDSGAPAISNNATDHLITVVYTPTGGGANNAIVLTAAADCSAVTPLLNACKAQLGAGSNAQCVPSAADMQVVARNNTNYLRFTFPDSASVIGSALSGPATIAVTSATPSALPCQLATSSCAAQSGLVACIDDYFANDGTCGRSGLQGTFNHFTALPTPNDFQSDCWDTIGPCMPSAAQFRMTTDKDGNILVPMDWRGILVKQNQVPVPRLLTATLSSPTPLLGIHIPGKSFVASYTPEGGLLPPIFEPESNSNGTSGVATLFGSADAPYTVLRLARRSDTYQQCSGGGNAGLPCNEAEDCPNGSCGPTVCFGGNRDSLPCSSDGGCPGGECGPELLDLRTFGQGGNGPIALNRFGAGVCQGDEPVNTCSTSSQCDMGAGTCVSYALTAENPVPLEGLALSPDVFAFAVNEAVDNVPRNNDGDTIDTVVTLRDRASGQSQPLGAPPSVCGIPATPAPEGRAVIRTQQAPFSFPAVATEGDVVAFLESEATTNNPTAMGNPACDMNGDGDTADAILRVYKLGSGEVTPSVPNPVGDGALQVNGRALAVSNGRVFFRSSEAEGAAQHTVRISLDPMGMQLNDLSGTAFTPNIPTVSYDGRYVIFDAYDDHVTNDPPTGRTHHLTVRDVRLGINELMNVNASGQLSAGCFDQTISADGRWVLFVCASTTLFPVSMPTCTNVLYGTTPCEQVALRDRCESNGVAVAGCTKHIELITADAMGNPGTDHTEEPSVSADGRYVVFRTWAPNLIGNPTMCNSKFYGPGTCPEIVMHDRCLSNGNPVAGCTVGNTIVSVTTAGARTNGESEFPVMSTNARVIAFQSEATNLDPRDPSPFDSIYVRDLDAGTTELVSVDSFGAAANNFAFTPAISGNGRFVSFSALADNLVAGDTNGIYDTFVHDRLTGTTERVSVDSNGREQPGPCPSAGSDGGALSDDGRLVLFQSRCSNIVPGVADSLYHVYVHDRATGITKIVDVNDAGVAGNDRLSAVAAYLSGDGRFAVFPSTASNLVANDTNNTCDNNNDGVFNENCSDIFVRGLDPSSANGDLTGDGQSDDTVLRVMDSGTGTVTTLCPADQVSVVAGAAAFLRPESAGATTNSGCTGPSLTGPNLNGPPDADTTDDVVHFVSSTNAVQNLHQAATSVVLSGLCAGGSNAKQPCTVDSDCPSSTCTPTYIAALVSEAGQNNTNLNGDNDTTPNDDVVQVYDLTAASPAWTNVGQAADAIDASGSLIAFITPEAAQDADLNGDGDKNDRVLQIYDASTKTRINTGLAADEFVIGSDLDVCTTSPMVAFRSPEAARCTVPLDQTTCHSLPPECPASKCDLNGDGDCCDGVLFVYAKGIGVVPIGQAVTPCLLEACDPRLPYRVFGATVKFLTYEIEQGADLNGNNVATDLILQQYDACKKERKVISAIDTSNPGTGSAKDPTADDPRDTGHTVITASNRCYQNTTLLLVPATCQTIADCPSTATACAAELVVAAPGVVPHHDTVLVPTKPVNITIPAGSATEIVKSVGIKVRNADILPAKEKSGHTISLSVEPGTCPALIVDGIDFDGKTSGDQDSVLLTGGQAKVAKVRLRVKRADFTTYNSKAPARCTLTVRASTVLADNQDPSPRNNVESLEVNVIDKNDAPPQTTHESVLKSANPVKLTIGEAGNLVTGHVSVKLVNADLSDVVGDAITLAVDEAAGDCPAGAVTVDAPDTLTVDAGKAGTAHLTVTLSKDEVTAANALALGRCTAVLRASITGNSEPDASNNSTHLLIEVNDKTDY